MTLMATTELPPQVSELLLELATAKKSGKLELNIKDGRIEAWSLTLTGRVDKPPK